MPSHVRRLVLVGASPGIADPAEREERRRVDDELAERIEAIGIEAFAREWGAQALFAGPGRAGRRRRARGPAAQRRRRASPPRCAGSAPA